MKIKPGLVYFIGSLGGLLFGIDSGLTGGVMSPARAALHMDAGQEVLMANIVTLGAGVVAIFAGVLNDKFGRKKMLVSASFIFVIGALLCSFAATTAMLILARFVLGAGIGIASATVPAFLAELAPAAKRSGIATLFQFAIVIGLCVAYVVDYLVLPSAGFAWMQYDYNVMLGFAAIPAVILFLFALLMPESPRFLAKTGKVEEAKAVLLGMRKGNQADADAEYAEIDKVVHEQSGGFKQLFTVGKKPLIAAFGLAFFQQMVGINAAFYYGPVIAGSVIPHPNDDALVHAGFLNNVPNHLWVENLQADQVYAILFGVVNIIATIITVLIMNKLTSYKKTLNVGAGIMCFFSILFVAIVNINLANPGAIPGILLIVMVCLYIVGFAFSWGPIMWNVIGEIFPLGIRGVGSAVGASANWFSNFIIMSIFGIIILKDANGVAQHVDYGFGLFAVGCILSIIFVCVCVPETKNRSLESIEEEFRAQKEGRGDNISLVAILSVLVISAIIVLVITFSQGIPETTLVPLAWGLAAFCSLGFIVAMIATWNAKKAALKA